MGLTKAFPRTSRIRLLSVVIVMTVAGCGGVEPATAPADEEAFAEPLGAAAAAAPGTCRPRDWVQETADVRAEDADTAPSVALALTALGTPVLNYFDGRGLEASLRTPFGWHNRVLVPEAPGGAHVAAMIDSRSRLHVAYNDTAEGPFRVMHVESVLPGDAARVQLVQRGSMLEPKVAVDGEGGVHIVHYSLAGLFNGLVRYAYKAPGRSFDEQVVASGFQPALTIDARGTLHMAYIGNDGSGRYATKGLRGRWTEGAAFMPPGGFPNRLSIAVNGGGRPQIAFIDYREDDEVEMLVHAQLQGTGLWQTEVVVPHLVAPGLGTSIVLSSTGMPHIAYADGPPDELHKAVLHAWRAAGGWRTETAGAGDSPSLGIDREGRLHLGSVEGRSVLYATRCPGR